MILPAEWSFTPSLRALSFLVQDAAIEEEEKADNAEWNAHRGPEASCTVIFEGDPAPGNCSGRMSFSGHAAAPAEAQVSLWSSALNMERHQVNLSLCARPYNGKFLASQVISGLCKAACRSFPTTDRRLCQQEVQAPEASKAIPQPQDQELPSRTGKHQPVKKRKKASAVKEDRFDSPKIDIKGRYFLA